MVGEVGVQEDKNGEYCIGGKEEVSHFVVLALVPGFVGQDVEWYVESILEPYSEEKEVPAYLEECWCVGVKALKEIRLEVDSRLGTIDVHRKAYWAVEGDRDKWWEEEVREPRERLEKELRKGRDDLELPDPKCKECEGTGKRLSTYNENSKWDWWVIGGRWTGYYDGYKPEEDPQNLETCLFCGGTGKRIEMGMERCNGCDGKGKRVKSMLERHYGDIFPVETLLAGWEENKAPFAIVTRDGWFEKGKMGWWAIVSDEKDKDMWRDEARGVLEKYRDHTAVVVDVHI